MLLAKIVKVTETKKGNKYGKIMFCNKGIGSLTTGSALKSGWTWVEGNVGDREEITEEDFKAIVFIEKKEKRMVEGVEKDVTFFTF